MNRTKAFWNKISSIHKMGGFTTKSDNESARSYSTSSDMSANIISGTPEDFKVTRVSGACHMPIRRVETQKEMKNSLGVVTMTNPLKLKDSGVKSFFDWVINKSIWCDAFPCKDLEANLQHGFLKRTDIPGSYFLGAAQLSRMSISELKRQIPVISMMMKEDYDVPLSIMAFVLVNWNVKVAKDGNLFTEALYKIDDSPTAIESGEVPHWPFQNKFSVKNAMHMIWNDFEQRDPFSLSIQYPLVKSDYPSIMKEDVRWERRSNEIPFRRDNVSIVESIQDRSDFSFFKKHFLCSSPSSFVRNFNRMEEEDEYKSMWPQLNEKRSSSIKKKRPKGNDFSKRLYLNFAALEDYCSKVVNSLRKKGVLA